MPEHFAKGSKVKWNWGTGHGEGTVQQVFTKRVKRTIKGKVITRNATEDDPAYMVVEENGNRVLKAATELSKV